MDLDSIEGLNEVRPAVYRAALKLLSLQKLCHLHVVSLKQILPALGSGGVAWDGEAGLSREEVAQALNAVFDSMPQEVPGHVAPEVLDRTCSLLFKLYDRDQTGFVSGSAIEVALIVLCSDTLSAKQRALVCVAERHSRERGTVSRSSLRALLQHLSKVPTVVQEEGVFGGVEAAVRSCFNWVLTPSVREDHVLSWLQSEPRLLLWLSTLHRLSVSQSVTHAVPCHVCKALPITGLRYRCMKCVNIHLCQTCFLTDRQTKKHKASHPVLEHCTQPSWKESMASLASSARHALLPRRYTRREEERRRGLMSWSSGASRNSPAPPESLPQLDAAAVRQSDSPSSPPTGRDLSHNAVVPPSPRACASPSSLQSKALQTEDTPTQPQRETELLKDVRDLQRDKWLLEQEWRAWRLAVQSEHGILEDRCSEMEVTVETLRQHNERLQDMLTRALSRTEEGAGFPEPHQDTEILAASTTDAASTASAISTTAAASTTDAASTSDACPSSGAGREGEKVEEEVVVDEEEVVVEEEEEEDDDDGEESELAFTKEEGSGEEEWPEEEGERGDTETQSTMMHWSEAWPLHPDLYAPAGLAGGACVPGEGEREEQQLGELVERLRASLLLLTHHPLRDRGGGEGGGTPDRRKRELLQAAEEVGDSIHHLVAALANAH